MKHSPDLKAQAQADHDAGRRELFADLKRQSTTDLHTIDPAILARLTPEQRAELFSGGGRRSQQPSRPRTSSSKAPKLRRPSLIRRGWNALPLVIRSQVAGAALVCLLGIGLSAGLDNKAHLTAMLFQPASLPRSTDAWPACGRLTRYTDGCVYRVRSGLSWRDAGDALAFDLAKLQRLNANLSSYAPLRRGDQLIVWRGVIPLEN